MKIAAVIDSGTVAINVGSDKGIKVSDKLRIANTVIDPDDGKVLGYYPNLKVVVTQVFPRFCVAETAVQKFPSSVPVTINIGDDVTRENENDW